MDDLQWLKARGAEGLLSIADAEDLQAGVKRVLKLMSDLRWHSAEEIRAAAGKDGMPASEGLRRLRELKDMGYKIDKQRGAESRLWYYKLIGIPQPKYTKQN